MEVGNVYQTKLTRDMHKWMEICRNKWPLMKSCKNF